MTHSYLHNLGLKAPSPQGAKAAVLFIRHGLLENENTRAPENNLSLEGRVICQRISEHYQTIAAFLADELIRYESVNSILARGGSIINSRKISVVYGEKDVRNLETAELIFPLRDKFILEPSAALDLSFYPPMGASSFMQAIQCIDAEFPNPEQRHLRNTARFKFLCDEYEKQNHGVWGVPSRGVLFQPIEESLMAFDTLLKKMDPLFRVFVGSEPVPSFYYKLIAKLSDEMRIPCSGIGAGEGVIFYMDGESKIIGLERVIPPILTQLNQLTP